MHVGKYSKVIPVSRQNPNCGLIVPRFSDSFTGVNANAFR
jgi:hypothetical protein